MTKYTLKTPVTHNGETYTELTIHKPRTGDLVVTDGFQGELSKTLALLASVTEIPLPAFKLIELDDFYEIQAIVEPMLGKPKVVKAGLQAGSTL